MAEEREGWGDSELIDAGADRGSVALGARVLRSHDEEVRVGPRREHGRRRLDELRLALRGVQVAEDAHDLGRVGKAGRPPGRDGRQRRDPRRHDPDASARAEGRSHRLAHAHDETAARRDGIADPAVEAEVVLHPDHRQAETERREHRDDRSLDAVRVHELGPLPPQQRAKPAGRREDGRRTSGRVDDVGGVRRAEALDERPVLQADDARDPRRSQLPEQRLEVALGAAVPGVRRDERDPERIP